MTCLLRMLKLMVIEFTVIRCSKIALETIVVCVFVLRHLSVVASGYKLCKECGGCKCMFLALLWSLFVL
jgi:hypothetical protein